MGPCLLRGPASVVALIAPQIAPCQVLAYTLPAQLGAQLPVRPLPAQWSAQHGVQALQAQLRVQALQARLEAQLQVQAFPIQLGAQPQVPALQTRLFLDQIAGNTAPTIKRRRQRAKSLISSKSLYQMMSQKAVRKHAVLLHCAVVMMASSRTLMHA